MTNFIPSPPGSTAAIAAINFNKASVVHKVLLHEPVQNFFLLFGGEVGAVQLLLNMPNTALFSGTKRHEPL
jgi:hypothetical protein